MASKPHSQLEEEVMCPICLEQLEDPRMLSCMHTYCKGCLEPLLTDGGTIKCPQCNEVFQVYGVARLKVNFWANKIISFLQWAKDKEQGGDEAKLMCNNCVNKEAAQVRCFDCEKYMCNECLSAHRRISELTKDHHVMTLEEIKSNGFPPVVEKLTFCDKHKGKKQKLFCKGCERLICKDCTVYDHKDHDYRFIVDIIGDCKERMTKEIQTAITTKKNVEASVKSVGEKEENVETNRVDLEKQINEIIDLQAQALEEKRKSLKEEVNAMTETKKKNLSSQKSDLELHQGCLKSAITFAENALAKGSNSEILSVYKDVTSRLSQLSTSPTSRDPLPHILEVDDELQQILSNNIGNFARILEYNPLDIDPKKCEVVWIPGIKGCYIHIKNTLGELIDIDEKRIDPGCSKNLQPSGKGMWYLNIRAHKYTEHCDTTNQHTSINVEVDGKPIKNGTFCYCAKPMFSNWNSE